MERHPISVQIVAESSHLGATTATLLLEIGFVVAQDDEAEAQDEALTLIVGDCFAPNFLDRAMTGPWTRRLDRVILFGHRIGFRTLAALDGIGFPFIVKSLPSPERLAGVLNEAASRALSARHLSASRGGAASRAIEAGSDRLFEHIRTGNLCAAVREARSAFSDFETLLDGTAAAQWLSIIQRYHDGTARHCSLVSAVAMLFARSLGFSGSDQRRLFEAAHFHDVGKVHVPLAVLDKPGPLDHAERATMETHAIAGYEILAGSDAIAGEIAEVARDHHEYLDGTGYPYGIGGRQIPDITRIITICDIFAALIERRTYKDPKTAREAYAILQSLDGKLDAPLLRAFSNVIASCSP